MNKKAQGKAIIGFVLMLIGIITAFRTISKCLVRGSNGWDINILIGCYQTLNFWIFFLGGFALTILGLTLLLKQN